MLYRDQPFVDRCYCDQPATARCAMCNRPRCAAHLDAAPLCHRCNEAVDAELAPRAGSHLYLGMASGAGVTMLGLIAHAPLVGAPIAAVTAMASYVASRVLRRRAAMRRLAPRLATTTGEVKPDRTADGRDPATGPTRHGIDVMRIYR